MSRLPPLHSIVTECRSRIKGQATPKPSLTIKQPVRAAAVSHRRVGSVDQGPVVPAGPLAPGQADSRCQARAGSGRASLIAGRAPIPVVMR
jgi:hypothetical protein